MLARFRLDQRKQLQAFMQRFDIVLDQARKGIWTVRQNENLLMLTGCGIEFLIGLKETTARLGYCT